MRRGVVAACSALLLLVVAARAPGHDGPPFPIIVDRQAGPYVISVWADPDVGTGTFFVILAPAPGKSLPEEMKVTVHVQPTSGRLPEASYECKRQNLRNRVQYHGEVEFDQQEMWRVRVQIHSELGAGEVSTEVEATPPGFGPWDLLLYGFPFILFGSLWMYAALRRRFSKPPT
ncbi:MAG: hypothetical protein HYX68_19315 [Planctomycetes bacterium]|nr:hypothetical protein [Planctomycetota bacterium]